MRPKSSEYIYAILNTMLWWPVNLDKVEDICEFR